MATMSGSRETVHSTARATARVPRDGNPRWKPDRGAMRRRGSCGSSPGIGSSTRAYRTQPASIQPHVRPAAATPPIRAPARDLQEVIAPETAPPLEQDAAHAGFLRRSDLELVENRRNGDDVPLELQLRLLEPGRDADELREVEDRHTEVLARRRAELRLPRIEREVAQRARRHHRIGTGLGRLLDGLDQLAERRLLARLDDREPAAL